jgi:hypothetical protein
MPKLEAFEINSLGHEAEGSRAPALTQRHVAVLFLPVSVKV